MHVLYHYSPPITVWTGLSLLGVAVAEAVWGRVGSAAHPRGEIRGAGRRLHPLAVARTLVDAKASAWGGRWWRAGGNVLVYLLEAERAARRGGGHPDCSGGRDQCAGACGRGAVAAARCKSPGDPYEGADDPDGTDAIG